MVLQISLQESWKTLRTLAPLQDCLDHQLYKTHAIALLFFQLVPIITSSNFLYIINQTIKLLDRKFVYHLLINVFLFHKRNNDINGNFGENKNCYEIIHSSRKYKDSFDMKTATI